MHIYIPALLEVVKLYHGNVIDIMGDGIMVIFGGRKQQENELCKAETIRNAGRCSLAMMDVREKVINRILTEENISSWSIDIGIGVTYGDVIVTKIGIPEEVYDVKIFGDCVNTASKYSKGQNCIHVSKAIRDGWPSSKGGKLKFVEARGGGYIITR
jgi:class 3 adenylate cyclase